MKAADDAGEWFDTVIGDHRAIDVIMSMAYNFDVDTEEFESIDDVVLEIERRHKIVEAVNKVKSAE